MCVCCNGVSSEWLDRHRRTVQTCTSAIYTSHLGHANTSVAPTVFLATFQDAGCEHYRWLRPSSFYAIWKRLATCSNRLHSGGDGQRERQRAAAAATGLRYVIKLTLACFMYADDKLVDYKNTLFCPLQLWELDNTRKRESKAKRDVSISSTKGEQRWCSVLSKNLQT